MKQIGIAGSDPRMLFSWYSGDLCTDPDFAELEPELRANPCIGSWPEGRGYLDQQRLRLPTHKYRAPASQPTGRTIRCLPRPGDRHGGRSDGPQVAAVA